ncbi:hypothetical protein AGIG_G25326 [Arapaima gigas]
MRGESHIAALPGCIEAESPRRNTKKDACPRSVTSIFFEWRCCSRRVAGARCRAPSSGPAFLSRRIPQLGRATSNPTRWFSSDSRRAPRRRHGESQAAVGCT